MAYILSPKISEVAWRRRCTSGVTQLEKTTGKFGGSQRGRRRGREIDRPSSTTLSLPENLEREGGRHPKNSSRQFQVGLHIITSLRQRCGGPKQSDGNDCKSLKRFFQVPVRRVRPQDICFSRNTQRTTFMSARYSVGWGQTSATVSHVDVDLWLCKCKSNIKMLQCSAIRGTGFTSFFNEHFEIWTRLCCRQRFT